MSGLRILRLCLVGVLSFTAHSESSNGDPGPLSYSVPENSDAGAVVGDIAADSGGFAGRCAIVAGNLDAAFSIDPGRGRLTVNNPAALNHEVRPRYELVLRVTRPTADDPARRAFLGDVLDSGAPLDAVEALLTAVETMHVFVDVDDVPEPPVLPTQSATLMVFGNERVEEGRIEAHDGDDGDALRFEVLAGAPEGLFGIDHASGRIWIERPAELAAGDHSFPLTVRVTDSSGRSDATTIAVRVVALAGEPSSLVVAAPEPPGTEPSDSAAAETDSSTSSVETPADPVEVNTEAAGSETEVAARRIPPPPIVNPHADNAGRAAPVTVGPPALPETHAPNSSSLINRLLRIAGIFLLLGVVVAAVMAWLWWQSRDDAEDLTVDSERLLRLQSISEESEFRNSESLQPSPPTTVVDEKAEGAPMDAGTELVAPIVPPEPDSASVDVAEESAANVVETGDTLFMEEGVVFTNPPGEELVESHGIELEELFEISRNEGHEAEPERVESDVDENLTDDFDMAGFVDTTPLPVLNAQDTHPLTRVPDPAPDTRNEGAEASTVESDSTPPRMAGPPQPESLDAPSDAMRDSCAQGSTGDSDEDSVDPRLSQLRSELAEKFGVPLRGPNRAAEPDTGELAPIPDPAAIEPASESVGASARDEAIQESAVETSEDDSGPTERPTGGFEGSTLTSARFMTKRAPELPIATEAAAPSPPRNTGRLPVVKRLDKSAMRRELSSLRAVANLHARASMAEHSTRKRARQTWFMSAGLMVVLNFAAMGLLAGGPEGILRVIGWGLMLAAAVTLAVCLHSFREMVGGSDLDGYLGTDEQLDSVSPTPVPEKLSREHSSGPAGVSLPVADSAGDVALSRGAQGAGTDSDDQASPGPSDPTIAARDETRVVAVVE